MNRFEEFAKAAMTGIISNDSMMRAIINTKESEDIDMLMTLLKRWMIN